MVITCENIRFITCDLTATHDESNIFTRDDHNHTIFSNIFRQPYTNLSFFHVREFFLPLVFIKYAVKKFNEYKNDYCFDKYGNIYFCKQSQTCIAEIFY